MMIRRFTPMQQRLWILAVVLVVGYGLLCIGQGLTYLFVSPPDRDLPPGLASVVRSVGIGTFVGFWGISGIALIYTGVRLFSKWSLAIACWLSTSLTLIYAVVYSYGALWQHSPADTRGMINYLIRLVLTLLVTVLIVAQRKDGMRWTSRD